ncbi:MAG TPA: cation diffusion facilitator family transporter [Bacteroidales bacterium]|nr:cation diffusion facilitator family transporter [Bacteroidales bacterium]
MERLSERQRQIKRASYISVGANLFLAVLKVVVGLLAGSMAVVADGVDSLSDVLASLITLFTSQIISKPPNKRHPYGYDKADTVASKLVAFVIFFAGAQLAIATIGRLFSDEQSDMPSLFALGIVIVSIFGKQLLSQYLLHLGRQIDSPMLRANGRNMQNDVIISASVLVGLVLTHVFRYPLLDLITALAVSVWIMFVAIRIIITSSRELMDGIEDQTIYSAIVEAVGKVAGAGNPHRIRARKMAHYYMIALDIEVDGNKSLFESHRIGHEVEAQIRKAIPSTYDVVVHVEPVGDLNPDEVFGVSHRDIDK